MTSPTVDEGPDEVEVALFAYEVAKVRAGAITAAMVHLGDRLGLYRTLADLERPVASAERADAAGLVERWVREWLYNQAAAGLVLVDDAERFSLSAAGAVVLADPDHEANLAGMFHSLPQTMQRLERLPDSFRTGVGYDYDAHGPDGAIGIERTFEPWMRAHFTADVVPLLDGVVARLEGGAAVADIGCGSGGVVLELAAAFPAGQIVGYEISHLAIDRARARLADSGLANVEFRHGGDQPIPDDGSFALVATCDCLHDMTDPAGMARTIRGAVADDGTWLLVDIKAYDTYAENVAHNPVAAMMYGESVMSCMSSGLSEPGGAGLGTLGLSARRAEAIARDAGFTRFRQLDVDHAVNAFYEIRP
jgi:SAM-dependent methyltransferase